MTYSFLMPYYNRAEQFHNTLISLLHWYGQRDDWEVVIIQDPKCKDDLSWASSSRVKIVRGVRDALNPCVAYNQAAKVACGTRLVVTNPECYHVADVLGYFDKVFAEYDRPYVVAACLHVKHIGRLNKYTSALGETVMWYQHSAMRNLQYHFCTAISKKDYEAIGGFDEEYAEGYCYDDDDFIDRVRCAKLHCVTDDTVLVLHQEHAKFRRSSLLQAQLERNKALYLKKSRQRAEA